MPSFPLLCASLLTHRHPSSNFQSLPSVAETALVNGTSFNGGGGDLLVPALLEQRLHLTQLLLTPFWNSNLLAFIHIFLSVLLIHGLLCSVFCQCGPSKNLGVPQDPTPHHLPGDSATLMALSPTCWLALKFPLGASLVAQWLRIRLPIQGTRVRTLVQEDPTCCGATKPVHHNYWACALEPPSHNYWACMPQLLKPVHLEPVLCNKRSPRNEKPAHRNEE